MGELVKGEWKRGWYESDDKGAFVRPDAQFKKCRKHPPERGRYHLYVSYACPWAHRSIITRSIRGLEDAIPMTVVDPKMSDDGWGFHPDEPDPLFGAKYLREIYLRAKPDYTGRVTVPVLWDKKDATIVCNESREIMRTLDLELNELATKDTTLAPKSLVATIDETLTAIYHPINNGVYRAGFATKQAAYDDAVDELFSALDHWDGVLATQRYLCGDVFTEADVAMFTTLLRFDLVYHAHFKCNVRRIQDYEHLWAFLRDIYQKPDVKKTCRLDHIKTHYYWSQTTVNPTRIVPRGPTTYAEALETPPADA
jgi:putative glutathione S-transferase